MSLPAWREEAIGKKHNRSAFDCGEAEMNEYLRRYARQNHESGGVKTFLAVSESDAKTILGFYSLSPASIIYSRTPEIVRRGLGRYDVPAFRSSIPRGMCVSWSSRARAWSGISFGRMAATSSPRRSRRKTRLSGPATSAAGSER